MELTLFTKLFLFYVLGFTVGFVLKGYFDAKGEKTLRNLIWKQQQTLREQSLLLAPKMPSKRGRPKGSKNPKTNTNKSIQTILGASKGKRTGSMKKLRKPRKITEGFQVTEIWRKA